MGGAGELEFTNIDAQLMQHVAGAGFVFVGPNDRTGVKCWLLIDKRYLCVMAKEEMAVTEYAKLRGVTRQNVLKQIANNRELPGVINYRKVGTQYILTVDPKKIVKKQA